MSYNIVQFNEEIINVAKMLKAIHAQDSKKAAREKAVAVVTELKSMKLPVAAKKKRKLGLRKH